MNLDNKYNNVIQATKKLGEIFYKAAHKHQLLDNNIDIKQKSENEIKEDKIKDNIDNNNIEEDEDSGDSFGIWFLYLNYIFYTLNLNIMISPSWTI